MYINIIPGGRCPPDPPHTGGAAPPGPLHPGWLRPPDPLHLGGCAPKPLQPGGLRPPTPPLGRTDGRADSSRSPPLLPLSSLSQLSPPLLAFFSLCGKLRAVGNCALRVFVGVREAGALVHLIEGMPNRKIPSQDTHGGWNICSGYVSLWGNLAARDMTTWGSQTHIVQ